MSAYKRTTLSNADYVRSWPNADVARWRSFRPVLYHSSNVSFWHKADIELRRCYGRYWVVKRTWHVHAAMSADDHKADISIMGK